MAGNDNMDAKTETLLNAGTQAHDYAELVRNAQRELASIVAELEAGWRGTAPIAFRQAHESWDTSLNAASQSLDSLGDKVTGAGQQYETSQQDAQQAVQSVEVPPFSGVL